MDFGRIEVASLRRPIPTNSLSQIVRQVEKVRKLNPFFLRAPVNRTFGLDALRTSNRNDRAIVFDEMPRGNWVALRIDIKNGFKMTCE